jgi:hypothetical protein
LISDFGIFVDLDLKVLEDLGIHHSCGVCHDEFVGNFTLAMVATSEIS